MIQIFSNFSIYVHHFSFRYSIQFFARLLNSTRDTVKDIQKNTEFDPGWIENGGIFIARNQVNSVN